MRGGTDGLLTFAPTRRTATTSISAKLFCSLTATTLAGALERRSHNGWCPRSQLGWWNFPAASSRTCSVPTRFDASVFRAISER